MSKVFPIVLCGGIGSRLWPLSRGSYPKQFLPLVSGRTMLQETVLRLDGLENLAAPILVSNEDHRFLAAEQMLEIGRSALAHLLEPAGRGTAPAVAAAALVALEQDPDATLTVLAADHAIEGLPQFHAALRAAVALAQSGKLVIFGIPPTEPSTGYGYIRAGAPWAQGSRLVEGFVEKPDEARARALLAQGGHFWNSGMFVFRADRFLAELERFQPALLAAVTESVRKGVRDVDFLRLDKASFADCPADSVDRAVMERTQDACMIEAAFSWSDVGAWPALWERGAADAAGNVLRGDVIAEEASGCYLRSESRLVAALGVSNLVVVETADAVLVADRGRAQDIKRIVERLAGRGERTTHRRIYRPWGYYESLDAGTGFQVKRLMIKPGAKISLQRHHRRAEHWVVVSGHARVVRGEEDIVLGRDQSTYIPKGEMHRLENTGAEPLFVIEVQSGDYLGEDDIERFADDYRRT
jgi:mannose-1-phosphate guanylyltransferase/mannose-6-phosphate isomerase